MIDKLVEEYFNMFSKGESTKPIVYYYVITNVDGERKVHTNAPQAKDIRSQTTKDLEALVKEKRKEMQALAQDEKFEEAIEARRQLNDLELHLKNSKKIDEEDYEKNKSAKELLGDLRKKLDEAVKVEDYETAAKIRDQIKAASDNSK